MESAVTVNMRNYPFCSFYAGNVNVNRLDPGLSLALIYVSELFAFPSLRYAVIIGSMAEVGDEGDAVSLLKW